MTLLPGDRERDAARGGPAPGARHRGRVPGRRRHTGGLCGRHHAPRDAHRAPGGGGLPRGGGGHYGLTVRGSGRGGGVNRGSGGGGCDVAISVSACPRQAVLRRPAPERRQHGAGPRGGVSVWRRLGGHPGGGGGSQRRIQRRNQRRRRGRRSRCDDGDTLAVLHAQGARGQPAGAGRGVRGGGVRSRRRLLQLPHSERLRHRARRRRRRRPR